jgi:chorismate synthase
MMHERIKEIIKAKDTLGGIIEVVALGLPPGLGSYVHADRRLDARLLYAMGTIPAVKGAEIGAASSNLPFPARRYMIPSPSTVAAN